MKRTRVIPDQNRYPLAAFLANRAAKMNKLVSHIAKDTGLSLRFVIEVENGTANPGEESLSKWALAIGVPLPRLLKLAKRQAAAAYRARADQLEKAS